MAQDRISLALTRSTIARLTMLLLVSGVSADLLGAQSRPAPRPAAPKAPVAAPEPGMPPLPPKPAIASTYGFDFDMVELQAAKAAMMSVDAERMAAAGAKMAAAGERIAAEVAANVAGVAALAPLAALQDELASGYGVTWSKTQRGYRTEAPEPWAAQDMADSLYREGRKALSGDAYRKAADIFRSIRDRYPKSSYAPDAPYWEAFALQRLGGEANQRAALEALSFQQREYPKAATRGDAASLSARIEGVLGRRDAAIATTLATRAQGATDGCPNAKDDERVDALNAVTQMDADRAMPILRKVLARREPCTQQLRRSAVWLVASRKQPESASILLNVARTDPDKEVREQAVFWMANVQSEEATNMLIDLSKAGDDLDLRKRAVYALSRSKSPKAASTLRDIVLDTKEPEDLRGDALNWYLGSSAFAGGEDTMGFLKDVFGRADGMRFRSRVLSSIAARRTDEARNFLVSVAVNERESLDVRRSAVGNIASSSGWRVVTRTTSGQNVVNEVSTSSGGQQSGTTSSAQATAAASALGSVFDKAADLDIRRSALSSLANLRENAGVDKLIDVARNEKNLELRRAAVSMLSRMKDPRAMALLQEIIDR
ncbi:MAG TPA: HEAT repeat domain-containing protein [Gemmatimonas sp.]|uniref:HEAT repeat domain-containing protein n=1 Tax=Gemmatimonas sp. TaxID=1962908 RepID=UPI002ED8585F